MSESENTPKRPLLLNFKLNHSELDIADHQFSRERMLPNLMSLDSMAIVIGLGGIGGHVAETLGSINEIRRLILFDGDIVETHNLNRTVFSHEHVGHSKAISIAQIVNSRNPALKTLPVHSMFDEDSVNELVEDSEWLELTKSTSRSSRYIHIFDCRDDDYQDHELQKKFVKTLGFDSNKVRMWRAAYNGYSITLDGHPEERAVWGQGGYTENSSHVIPAKLVGTLIVLYACTFHLNESLYIEKIPMTIDIRNIISALTVWKGLDALYNVGGLSEAKKNMLIRLIEQSFFNPTEGAKKLDSFLNQPGDISEISYLKQSIKTLQHELNQNLSDLYYARRNLSNEKLNVSNLERAVSELERAVEAKNSTIEQLQATMEAQRSRINQLIAKIAKLEGQPSTQNNPTNINDEHTTRRV